MVHHVHTEAFQLYSGGVYQDSECSQVFTTHAMLLVGYELQAEVPYWILKNSCK